MMFAHGCAYPRNTTLVICCRGVAYSSASFTVGFRSSRFFGLSGFELKPRFVTSSPAWTSSVMPVWLLSALPAEYGTASTKSRLPAVRSATIEVEFV